MSKKRVYAALEIADQEIRLLVFEVFDGRENVLRVERLGHDGVKDQKIVNETAVVKAIQEVMANAQSALGYRIDRVLLAIPSIDVKQIRQKVRVRTEEGAPSVRLFHVQQGYETACQKREIDNKELVNSARILYVVDGEESSKLPVGKECDEFIMYVDLLYADKDVIYSYVRAAEQANLEVMDLVLDSYASSLETAALVQSDDRPIIQINLESAHTTLSFFMNERLMNVTSIPEGYDSFIKDLKEQYGLSNAVCYRLLQNIFSAKEEENGDTIVYIEQNGDERIEITAKELYEAVVPKFKQWIEDIDKGCEPLLASGNVRYIITGQGANLPLLKELKEDFNSDVQIYLPSTVGARDNAFTTALGQGYAWQNVNKIKHNDKISTSRNELEASLDSIKSKSSKKDGSFTKKMKSVILGSK